MGILSGGATQLLIFASFPYWSTLKGKNYLLRKIFLPSRHMTSFWRRCEVMTSHRRRYDAMCPLSLGKGSSPQGSKPGDSHTMSYWRRCDVMTAHRRRYDLMCPLRLRKGSSPQGSKPGSVKSCSRLKKWRKLAQGRSFLFWPLCALYWRSCPYHRITDSSTTFKINSLAISLFHFILLNFVRHNEYSIYCIIIQGKNSWTCFGFR